MKRKKRRVVGWLLLLLLCISLGTFLVSCSIFRYEPVVMTPPTIPGATYVGAETCAQCHEAESRYFELTDHASVSINITDEDAEAGQAESCETCHGPGSLHVEGRGDKSKIIRANAETACFKCHLDVKGKFMLQYHHPVPEGRMSCTDCHDMHGKDVRATGGKMLLGAGLLGKSDKCFKCHKEQRGPFVFEHEAMREGCPICHNPHGSINDKLLVAGPTITCIRCHIDDKHGAVHHNKDCVSCHVDVHGSNIEHSLTAY